MKKRNILILVGIIVLFVLSYFGYQYLKGSNLSYVTISINPDVELTVNSQNKVTEVTALNSDGDVIISDLDLVGLNVEDASEKVIAAAVETGLIDEYSDENTIVVTTVNDNEKIRANLEERVMNNLNTYLETKRIYPVLVAKGLGTELKTEADKYNISYGKMLLVEEAMALNSSLNKDDLVKMSVQDIQKEIKSYIKANHDALKATALELKTKWQQQKEQLKTTKAAKIQALKDSIYAANKDTLDSMTAAEKANFINNYLKQAKANLKQKIKQVISNIKESTKDTNYPVLNNNTQSIKETIKERIKRQRNK